jgi:hypothetical protein
MTDCAEAFDSTSLNRPSSLGEPVDFDIRGLGRRLPRTEAPEGWIKKVERQREGKVWVGFFHVWTTGANGCRLRRKKEKTLGPASMPKHEAQSKLADYIEEYTGRITRQGSSIATFLTSGRLSAPSGPGAGRRRRRRTYDILLRNMSFPASRTHRRAKSR